MENTGNGVKESTMGNPNTAASSMPSPKRGKRNTTRTEKPTTPAEAGELLLSALDYCKIAGLRVTGYNDGSGLVLRIEGLQDTGSGIFPYVTPQVTPISPIHQVVTPNVTP